MSADGTRCVVINHNTIYSLMGTAPGLNHFCDLKTCKNRIFSIRDICTGGSWIAPPWKGNSGQLTEKAS